MAGEAKADDADKPAKAKADDATKPTKPRADDATRPAKAKADEKPSKPKADKVKADDAKPAKAKAEDSSTAKSTKAKADDKAVATQEADTAAAAAAAEVAAPEPPPEPKEEASYGLSVDPTTSFAAARQVVQQLHETLRVVQDIQVDGDGAAKTEPSFTAIARQMQNQLLALRRAHRGMAKAAEVGRLAEATARRIADAEYAHLETRRYESACCRAAARRCRAYPTPQLSKLRPLLEGASALDEENEEEDEEEEEADGSKNGLAARLEAEKIERARLADELSTHETMKAEKLQAFRDSEKFESDLMTRLRAVERALEPVCDLLEVRKRPDDAAASLDADALTHLPPPLRLIHSKFDMLATFGALGGVAVHVDQPEPAADEPPAKRARTEGGASQQSLSVRVEIAAEAGAKSQAPLVLRFVSPNSSLVTVAIDGSTDEALLQGLWPEDDGLNGTLGALVDAAGAADKPGTAFGWAQVFAGLRESTLAASPSLSTSAGVTASDVVLRLRRRVSEGAKG